MGRCYRAAVYGGRRGTDGRVFDNIFSSELKPLRRWLSPMAVKAEALLGGRKDQGFSLVMAGRCLNPPSHGISGSSSLLSLPAPVSAAWSCPCQQLLLHPLVSSLSLLTDPIPPAVCSALPCRPLLAARHCPGASLCVQGLKSTSDKC